MHLTDSSRVSSTPRRRQSLAAFDAVGRQVEKTRAESSPVCLGFLSRQGGSMSHSGNVCRGGCAINLRGLASFSCNV